MRRQLEAATAISTAAVSTAAVSTAAVSTAAVSTAAVSGGSEGGTAGRDAADAVVLKVGRQSEREARGVAAHDRR